MIVSVSGVPDVDVTIVTDRYLAVREVHGPKCWTSVPDMISVTLPDVPLNYGIKPYMRNIDLVILTCIHMGQLYRCFSCCNILAKRFLYRKVSSGMLRCVTLVRTVVPPKRRFLQEPHGVTSQKTPFFIVTAVKTSNLTGLQHS
jgi:hypothetical protein